MIAYLVAKVSTISLPAGDAEKEGRICDVFVVPACRRKGVASLLYGAAADWFAREQCDCEGLTVYPANPASALYEKWGFEPFSINMRKRR